MTSRRSTVLQALTLWFVVLVALQNTEQTGLLEYVVFPVGIALLYGLPLYIVGAVVLDAKRYWGFVS
jgi:hypothetical protein